MKIQQQNFLLHWESFVWCLENKIVENYTKEDKKFVSCFMYFLFYKNKIA